MTQAEIETRLNHMIQTTRGIQLEESVKYYAKDIYDEHRKDRITCWVLLGLIAICMAGAIYLQRVGNV